ncbi:MAG: hypothetical protein ACTSWR_07880 [Candidatus Helarchaeota archaeon]
MTNNKFDYEFELIFGTQNINEIRTKEFAGLYSMNLRKIYINLNAFNNFKDEDNLIYNICKTIEHEVLHYVFHKLNIFKFENRKTLYIEETIIELVLTCKINMYVTKIYLRFLFKNIKEHIYIKYRKHYGECQL